MKITVPWVDNDYAVAAKRIDHTQKQSEERKFSHLCFNIYEHAKLPASIVTSPF
jgi:hypothetical protein